MSHLISRRGFLGAAAAGTAVLTVPGLLASCRKAAPVRDLPPDNPFLAWFGIDESTIRTLMSELTSRGADFADLFFEHRRTNTVTLEDGIVSRATCGVDQGVGLRVVVGDQTGYAFTEDLSPEAMREAARTAASIAQGSRELPPVQVRLATHPSYYSLERPWSEVGIDAKLPVVQRVEELARAGDPAIHKVTVSWVDQESRVLVADEQGRIHTDVRPMTRLWCRVTARKGEEVQSNAENIAGRRSFDWYTEDRLQELARQAVDKTMVLFDARRPPAGEMPVVLGAGPSGILLHEAIGHGMEADFNRKGVSIYSDEMGKPVAPDFVTIVDDGTIPHARGAIDFDDEGNDSQRTVLVKDGVLTSYLHDRISARHYGVDPTGSGRRQSFRHVPLPRMRCTFMEDGPHHRDEIIGSVERGILAQEFTNGQVNIGAGDFTFYIKNGWMIEGGELTFPIKDCNIIGNGPEALRKVTMAAGDGRLDTGGWTCGKDGQMVPVSQGLPTVLVSELTVGGESA